MHTAAIAIVMAGLGVAASHRLPLSQATSSFDDWTPPSSPNKTVASETPRKSIVMAGLGVAASYPFPWLQAKDSFDDWTPPSSPSKTVASETLKKLFNKAVLTSSKGKDSVLAMEAAMKATYRALPKMSHGLLSPSAAAYLVQKYTVQTHHYNIKGLVSDPLLAEEDAINETILQTSAPEVLGALLESRQGGRGLTLRDTAALAVMLHQLVTDHAVEVMDKAFEKLDILGMLPGDEEVSLKTLVKLVWAWQWLHVHDWKTEGNLLMGHMHEPTPTMDMYGKLTSNLARTKFYQERDHQNPFKPMTLSVADVMQLAQRAEERMGEWQENDCKVMKNQLVALDPEGDGRVPLAVLYNQPMEIDETGEQTLHFTEDQDYLRTSGALDESIPNEPQVLISNYILGPANCYASTSLHTFCCLNECDAVLSKIERAVKGSSARPAVLAPLLGNLTTPFMDEPQPFSEVLTGKLSAIAAQNHGRVPLHGRLFAQWLHFAFPYECPYPHITQKDEAGNVLMTGYFQEGTAGNAVGWTDDEMLPFGDVEPWWALLRDRNLFGAVFMMLAVGTMFNQVRMMARAHMRNLQKEMVGMGLDKVI